MPNIELNTVFQNQRLSLPLLLREAATVIVVQLAAVEVCALSPTLALYQCNSSMSRRQILLERRTDPILYLSLLMELNSVQLKTVLQRELQTQQYHLEVAHLQHQSLQVTLFVAGHTDILRRWM